MKTISLIAIICCFSLIFDAKGQGGYPPNIDGAEKVTYKTFSGMGASNGLEERLGTKPENISPYHNLVGKLPPTIIFHGTADKTVPFISAQLFTKKMHELGNTCTLVGYKGAPHGFFNYNSNAVFVDTMHKMDEFLVSLGYLIAPPETVIFTN